MDRTLHEISSPVSTSTLAEQKIMSDIIGQDEILVTVIKGVEVDMGLNSPIAQLRADTLKSKDFPIVRKHVFVPDLLVSTVDVYAFLRKTLIGDTLSVMAINLQSAMASMTGDTGTLNAPLSLLREVDQLMTKKVNECLNTRIETSVNIDSFMDDYPSLYSYILKKHGAQVAERLAKFDRDLVTLLNSEFNQKVMKDDNNPDKDINIPIEVGAGLFVGHLPNTYTVTLIPLDRAALELPSKNLMDSEGKKEIKFLVDQNAHRVVYEAVKTLFAEDNPDNEFAAEGAYTPIEKHILVTRDNARYYVREVPGGSGFYLKKI